MINMLRNPRERLILLHHKRRTTQGLSKTLKSNHGSGPVVDCDLRFDEDALETRNFLMCK